MIIQSAIKPKQLKELRYNPFNLNFNTGKNNHITILALGINFDIRLSTSRQMVFRHLFFSPMPEETVTMIFH